MTFSVQIRSFFGSALTTVLLSSCGVPQNFTLFRTSTPELGRFSLVGRNVFDGGMSEIRVSEQSLIIRCQNSRKIILDKIVSAMPDNID
jgi:hypothetical protein